MIGLKLNHVNEKYAYTAAKQVKKNDGFVHILISNFINGFLSLLDSLEAPNQPSFLPTLDYYDSWSACHALSTLELEHDSIRLHFKMHFCTQNATYWSNLIECQSVGSYCFYVDHHYTPAQRSWRGGILDSPCPSVRLSVRPSVCL